METVKILRLLIVKGTKCCLNCLIILYTKNCPKLDVTDIINKSMVNYICYQRNTRKDHALSVIIAMINVIANPHLLMSAIIYVGFGLKFTFIQACRSGKNPSATKWKSRNTIPINYYFTSLCFVSGSENWKTKIPNTIIRATIIFLGPSFKLGSCTREQKTPINTTGNMLHD